MRNSLGIVFLAATISGVTGGCGGTLSPLYSDFRIEEPPVVGPSEPGEGAGLAAEAKETEEAPTASLLERIAEGLVEAGWELDEAPSENAVSTTEIPIVNWALYSVYVSLDVVPVNEKFVRVYVHPYRVYFWGSRNKMSYMNRRVRSYVFPDLAEAFRARGITPLGTIPKKDFFDAEEEEDAQETVSASRALPPR